jgi:hypothetical protein
MFTELWKWIVSQPASGASFIGTVMGSSLGLLALLIGALFNAHLNRKRDDRLRDDDRRTLISTLKAELSGIRDTLTRNADGLDNPHGGFVVPDLAHSVRLMPHLLPKMILLSSDTVREVIGVYVSIDQYCEALMMAGGTLAPNNRPDRRVIAMPVERARYVAGVNRQLVGMITTALQRLDAD